LDDGRGGAGILDMPAELGGGLDLYLLLGSRNNIAN
jgi:hypothetical protein